MPRSADLMSPPVVPLPLTRAPLPLQGITVLAVEDSRFACEALRLMCQRSGARLRRADSLAAAEAHLRCYRPDVILVDLGLPDGRGEDLIARLSETHSGIVLGMSGDPAGHNLALAAGAQGYLDKPVPGLQAFQTLILSFLPDGRLRPLARDGDVRPDRLALHDDLIHAADAVAANPGPQERAYLSGFLAGLARQAQDGALAAASQALRDPRSALPPVAALLRDRIAGSQAFGPDGT